MQPKTDASFVPVKISKGLDLADTDVLVQSLGPATAKERSSRHELVQAIEHVLNIDDRSFVHVYVYFIQCTQLHLFYTIQFHICNNLK